MREHSEGKDARASRGSPVAGAPRPKAAAPAQRDLVTESEIRIRSVGVDIGSATTHMVFSGLTLVKVGNRYVVARREILHESPIILTPYIGKAEIDGDELEAFVNAQFRASGLARDDVDTGALILTGVALLRRNARRIAEVFAREAGRFVAVSAGDELEAIMAGHGSGSVQRSIGSEAAVLNIDIGGGTTKLSVCAGGRVVSTAAIDVGARLVVVDTEGRVCRVEPAGRRVAGELEIDVALGRALDEGERRRIAAHLADELMKGIPYGTAGEASPLLRGAPLEKVGRLGAVLVSGGVAEYLYGRESRDFGDLGPFLAHELRVRVADAGMPLADGGGGIRATVLGASQYTVQVSGSTIHISRPDMIPIRNVPVVVPDLPLEAEEVDQAAVTEVVGHAVARSSWNPENGALAVGVRWLGRATYARLFAVACGIVGGTRQLAASGAPLIIVCDDDIGRLLGSRVGEARPGGDVISVDGLEVGHFDFIDIGEMLPGTGSVPVVIKSLVFPPPPPTDEPSP